MYKFLPATRARQPQPKRVPTLTGFTLNLLPVRNVHTTL
jgi:hypothetical protein